METSDFEKNLFADGLFEGDFSTGQDVRDEHIANLLSDLFGGRQKALTLMRYKWLKHFNGRIPARWTTYWDPCKDIEVAGKQHVRLSSVLLDAGISHPNPYAPLYTAKYHKLDEYQLGIVLIREMPGGPWAHKEAIEKQKALGTPEDILDRANKTRFGSLTDEQKQQILTRFALPIERATMFG